MSWSNKYHLGIYQLFLQNPQFMARNLNVYILINFYSYQKRIHCNKDFSLIWRKVYSTKVLDYCLGSSSLIFTTTTKTALWEENIVLYKSLHEWMSLKRRESSRSSLLSGCSLYCLKWKLIWVTFAPKLLTKIYMVSQQWVYLTLNDDRD